jgi:hypothetical protein
MAAIDELNSLLAPLPGYALLTDGMKNNALAGALVPDSFGVWPGEEGYEATYDVYWAAINLIGYLRAQPVVRQTSSEGTSVAVDAPDWNSLLMYFRSVSRIVAATGGSILTLVEIPDVPHVKRVPMNYGGDQHADVDTDTR